MAKIYQHKYEPISVYGNVVSLLREQVQAPGLHLDIGCGYGAIAEPIRDELGLTYIGFDMANDGLDSLSARNFETHQIDLSDVSQCERRIREVIRDRPVVAISLIDTLEHLINGDQILSLMRCLAEPDNTTLVLSVPNVTHKDIALKLLGGRWDITESGLLDATHVRLYSHTSLSRTMKATGWHEIATCDWLLQQSDQYFPASVPLLNRSLPIGEFLLDLVSAANPHAIVNQFVRLYRPAPPAPEPFLVNREEREGPFLSVIIRTQGARLHTLTEALMCLGGQTNQDFEIILVIHSQIQPIAETVSSCIYELPDSIRSKITAIICKRPGRSAPLNDGLKAAKGNYFVVLDDDDLVFAHWVEAFQALSIEQPGKLLRSICVRQEVENIPSTLGPTAHPTSWFLKDWPSEYDSLAHLAGNSTPIMSIAYPRGIFQECGLRYDEGLETTEDWDFLLRAAMLCDVASTSEVTAIYRWWTNGESTQCKLPSKVWNDCASRVREKMDSQPILLPPGSSSRIVELLHQGRQTQELNKHNHELNEMNQGLNAKNQELNAKNQELNRNRKELAAILIPTGHWIPWAEDEDELKAISAQALARLIRSSSWRSTRPLRRLSALLRRRSFYDLTAANLPSSFEERQRLISDILRSTSWRIASPVRFVSGILKAFHRNRVRHHI